MPITKSAIKALRQSAKHRERNVSFKRRMKEAIKTLRELIRDKKNAEALKKLPALFKLIDTSAKKNLIHKNNAARKKSRLTLAVNKIMQVTSEEKNKKGKKKEEKK